MMLGPEGLMAKGEGGELDTGSLLESSRTIGGSGCMILGGILLASNVERKKL